MTLTPEQTKAVSEWVAAGDNLYSVQKKLADVLKISMTYKDVRFLVDDLNLQLKDPKPKADASDVSKGAPAPVKPAPGSDSAEDETAPPVSAVRVNVDKTNLNPNAMATGTVTFPDGVTGKWMVDLQGRPGLVDVSKPGYRPSPADAQAFMQELSMALQGL
ncbi:MAG TPA: hypothetical protein VII43_05170 [Opitutaceae bacterium]